MVFTQRLKEVRSAEGVPEPAPGRFALPVAAIRPNPGQPRRGIDEESPEFRDLVESIRLHGLIQPVAVLAGVGGYDLVAGERRWRAYRRLAEKDERFAEIPAVVLPAPSGDAGTAALVLGLLENVVREDLAPGDRAAAVARLRESTGWGYEKIAEFLGLGLRTVTDLAAIAEAPEPVVEAVNEGRVTLKQAAKVARAAGRGELEHVGDLVGLMEGEEAQPAPQVQMWEPASAAAADVVRLVETPLRACRPRVAEMPTEEYREMLRAAQRELRKAG